MAEKKPIDAESARPVWEETLGRLARVAVATTIGGAVEAYQNDPRFLAVIPVISMIGKYLRIKFPRAGSWLPF